MATAFPTGQRFKAGFVDRTPAATTIKAIRTALGDKRDIKRIDSHLRGLIRRYQAKNKLTITGELDSATWLKLGL